MFSLRNYTVFISKKLFIKKNFIWKKFTSCRLSPNANFFLNYNQEICIEQNGTAYLINYNYYFFITLINGQLYQNPFIWYWIFMCNLEIKNMLWNNDNKILMQIQKIWNFWSQIWSKKFPKMARRLYDKKFFTSMVIFNINHYFLLKSVFLKPPNVSSLKKNFSELFF